MKKLVLLLVGSAFAMVASGCTVTLPTDSYYPQNYIRYDTNTSVDMGCFIYEPYEKGDLRENQLRNTAVGSILISSSVSESVKRVTALELEKTGIKLNDSSPIEISGVVHEFTLDDYGYNAHWIYRVTYIIKDKSSNQVKFKKEFAPPMKKTGKSGQPSDYASVFHEIILSGYYMFIRDEQARSLLENRQ